MIVTASDRLPCLADQYARGLRSAECMAVGLCEHQGRAGLSGSPASLLPRESEPSELAHYTLNTLVYKATCVLEGGQSLKVRTLWMHALSFFVPFQSSHFSSVPPFVLECGVYLTRCRGVVAASLGGQ